MPFVPPRKRPLKVKQKFWEVLFWAFHCTFWAFFRTIQLTFGVLFSGGTKMASWDFEMHFVEFQDFGFCMGSGRLQPSCKKRASGGEPSAGLLHFRDCPCPKCKSRDNSNHRNTARRPHLQDLGSCGPRTHYKTPSNTSDNALQNPNYRHKYERNTKSHHFVSLLYFCRYCGLGWGAGMLLWLCLVEFSREVSGMFRAGWGGRWKHWMLCNFLNCDFLLTMSSEVPDPTLESRWKNSLRLPSDMRYYDNFSLRIMFRSFWWIEHLSEHYTWNL